MVEKTKKPNAKAVLLNLTSGPIFKLVTMATILPMQRAKTMFLRVFMIQDMWFFELFDYLFTKRNSVSVIANIFRLNHYCKIVIGHTCKGLYLLRSPACFLNPIPGAPSFVISLCNSVAYNFGDSSTCFLKTFYFKFLLSEMKVWFE